MKLPFDLNEKNLKEIVNNILERAKEIKQSLKTDPVATVKNYKSLLDLNSLAVVKKKVAKKKTTSKSKNKRTSKKISKKTSKKTKGPSVH